MAPREAFDVVVVGAGAAGCVVAARLATSTRRSVLLLEAGPDLRANPPDAFRDGWSLPPGFDWDYSAEPDDRGIVEDLRRGRLVGGTSILTRFAVRGSPADFEDWPAADGISWRFGDVLPYFTRLESDIDFGDEPWHGSIGPVPIDRYRGVPPTEIMGAALVAMESVGFPVVQDHNRPGAVGAGPMPMSSRNGVRVTTADAYLPAADAPSNLTIRPGATVADIVFEGDQACGVRLLDSTTIDAGWVLLCAGTYGSPPILMRSGIGPADHLAGLGIPVRVDLPGVGANLRDHPGVDIECGDVRAGRNAPILHTIGTFHSSTAGSGASPDLMLWLADPRTHPGGPTPFEIDVVLLKPKSRGSVRLRSADPADAPRVRLPGVQEPADLERLIEGLLRGLEVASHPEIRGRGATGGHAATDAAGLRSWIRANAYSIPHTVGTCSMGGSPDDGSVVDPLGRVHGVDRLSVVDASIIPEPPSGFPHLVTIMLAERLSDEVAARL
jgi:choline dehydrogenase